MKQHGRKCCHENVATEAYMVLAIYNPTYSGIEGHHGTMLVFDVP